MNEMTLWKDLEFEGHDLPVFYVAGKPYWIAKQAGRALGYEENGAAFVRMISRDWSDEFMEGEDFIILRGKDLKDFKVLSGVVAESAITYAPSLMLLSEPGVLGAALMSRKPVGRRLRRWLRDEVLPNIARHGSYAIAKPTNYAEALRGWADEWEKVQLLTGKIEEDRPYVEFGRDIASSEDVVDMAEMAQIISNMGIVMGRTTFFRALRNLKIIKPHSPTPYQPYVDDGYFVVEDSFKIIAGKKRMISQTFVTGKGQLWLQKKFRQAMLCNGKKPASLPKPAQMNLSLEKGSSTANDDAASE